MAQRALTETVEIHRDDGSLLAVERSVISDGFPLLVHSGSPGSRRLRRGQVEAAARAGFCLLGYDRPGYGESSPREGRVVADAACEVAAIAEALGYSNLAVWGFSGGGPFALASAALLPGLVRACCVLASLAPHDAFGAEWAAAWPADAQAQVDLFFTDRAQARDLFSADAAEMFARFSAPQAWLERWGDEAGHDDAHSLEMATYLAEVQVDASAQGDRGWWDDWAALLSPWGFEAAAIEVPVQLWHGEADAAAPVPHGRWLAEQIPTVDAHFVPGANHADIEQAALPTALVWLRNWVQCRQRR